MSDVEVPVLIVGGGAGLTASMLMSQSGIDSLPVSTWPTTSILPKAHVEAQTVVEGLKGLYNWGPPPPPSFLAPEDLAALMTGSHTAR
jgi:succinate dehydrogenase/fumarate reductase flavoprotein subunit